MRNFSDKTCRENRNTHFIFKKSSPKFVQFIRQCAKRQCRTTGRWLQYNTAHRDEIYMLDKQGYRHTLRLCNTYGFHSKNGYANASQ